MRIQFQMFSESKIFSFTYWLSKIIQNYIFKIFAQAFFFNLFTFISFYVLFFCQLYSFMNDLASSFLPQPLSDALVMWLEHQTYARTIQVRISPKPNFFTFCTFATSNWKLCNYDPLFEHISKCRWVIIVFRCLYPLNFTQQLTK